MRQIHLLSFVLLFLVTACGGKKPADPQPPVAILNAPEICYVTYYDDGNDGTDNAMVIAWDYAGAGPGRPIEILRNGEVIGRTQDNIKYFVDSYTPERAVYYSLRYTATNVGAPHTSIYLTSTYSDTNASLRWNDYQGFAFDKYLVCRKRDGAISYLKTVNRNILTYTVSDYEAGDLYFVQPSNNISYCPEDPIGPPTNGKPGRESTRSNYSPPTRDLTNSESKPQ